MIGCTGKGRTCHEKSQGAHNRNGASDPPHVEQTRCGGTVRICKESQCGTEVFLVNTTWAIVHKATGRVIGSIGLEDDSIRKNIRSRELGYSLSEDYWGEGLMTEAAKRMIRYSFEETNITMLMIRTAETNRRSQRVIEKCGFRYEGTLRKSYRLYDGTVRDTRFYSMLREEYEQLYAE